MIILITIMQANPIHYRVIKAVQFLAYILADEKLSRANLSTANEKKEGSEAARKQFTT